MTKFNRKYKQTLKNVNAHTKRVHVTKEKKIKKDNNEETKLDLEIYEDNFSQPSKIKKPMLYQSIRYNRFNSSSHIRKCLNNMKKEKEIYI